MATLLNPYLMFEGNAREAMERYREIFGGELHVMTYGDMGETGELADKLMHSALMTEAGYALFGSDVPPDAGHAPGNGVISLSGDESERLHGYWDGLAEGGAVDVPLEQQMWGDEFGQLTDRFGVSWMVNIGSGGGAG